MHKLLYISCFLCCSVFTANAQYVPGELDYYKKYRSPLASFYFDISLGPSIGVGQWGAAPSAELPLLAPFVGEDGMGVGGGAFISLGFTIPLVFKMDYANSLYPTIGYGIEAASHGAPNWETAITVSPPEATSTAFNLSGYLNGGLNYNLNNVVVIEAHAKMLFSFESGQPGLQYYSPITGDQEFSIEVPESNYELAWSPGYAYSLGFRFSKLRVFAELYSQKIVRYYEYNYIENGSTETEEFNSNFKVQTLRFGISYIADLL